MKSDRLTQAVTGPGPRSPYHVDIHFRQRAELWRSPPRREVPINKTGLSETPNPVRSKGMKLPDGLTLRELEALTSLGLSGLLAFFLAGITGEKIVFAKGIAEIRVGFQEGAGDA